MLSSHYKLLIGDEFRNASAGEVLAALDPGNGEIIATVALAEDDEVDAAVDAARWAFDCGGWPDRTVDERAEVILQLADLMQSHVGQLALLEARDSGALLAQTTSDVFQATRFMRAMAYHATHSFPWREPVPGRGSIFDPARNYLRREPVGVCAAIIPSSSPLLTAIYKTTMALLVGNTLVLKPSSKTPLSALLLSRLVIEAGIPKGVINVIVGAGPRVGERLVSHSKVDRVSFTGSTAVGRTIAELSACNLKRVSLGLGGNGANIVMPDADMDMAVDGALVASMLQSGQLCGSGGRLLLHDSIHDKFVAELARRASQMKVGYQLDPRTSIGPMVSEARRAQVQSYIALGKQEGARIVIGEDCFDLSDTGNGFYVAPTIFCDVRPEMTIAREEIFGPVLSVFRWRDQDEAIAIANNSVFGLAGGVWSSNLEAAERLAARLQVGVIWINDWHAIHPCAPFGGRKQSGMGRELGECGLAEFTELKHIHVGTEAEPNAKRRHRLLVRRGQRLGYEGDATPRIVAGPGSIARLSSELQMSHRQRVLLLTDRGVAAAGLVSRAKNALGERLIAIFDDVPQDTGLDVIDAAAGMGRGHHVDCVVSLGGGSVIDTAKAVCVALGEGLRAVETIGLHKLERRQMMHIAIPTTAGTGSEVTNAAVIRNERLRAKSIILDRYIVPDIAILDPTLTLGLSAPLTASTGMDALTHAVEAYLHAFANPVADAHCLHAIRLIADNLVTAVENGSDLDSRSAMQNAAMLAGLAVTTSSVGLVHAMSHTIGARYGIPHGLGNGILLPHVMRFLTKTPSNLQRKLKVIGEMLGAKTSNMSELEGALAAADQMESMLIKCKHPRRLRDMGVPRDELRTCSEAAHVDISNLFSFPRASVDQIEEIYIAAYGP